MNTPSQIAADGIDKFQQMNAEMASLFAQGLSLPLRAALVPFKTFEDQQPQPTGYGGYQMSPLNIPQMFTTSQQEGGIPGIPQPPMLEVPQGMQSMVPIMEVRDQGGAIQSVPIGPPILVPLGTGIQNMPPPPPGAKWKLEKEGLQSPESTGYSGGPGGMPQGPEILNIGSNGDSVAEFTLL